MKPEQLAARLQGGAFAAMKERAMTRIVAIGLRRSQPKTPVRSGALKQSETTRVEGGGEKGFLAATVGYAGFVHERIPFFSEGISEGTGEMVDALRDEVEKFLDDIAS